MKLRNPAARRPREAGMTLVEVLVALVVLSVGLLGIAAMQAVGLRSMASAGSRSQATLLAYDIVDRMRANRARAGDGEFDIDFEADLAEANEDVIDWKGRLSAALPAGDGSIATDGADPTTVTVTVRWLDRDDNRAADAQQLQFTTTATL